jgi:hypothetical protein
MEAVVYFSLAHWHSRVAPTVIFAPSGGSKPWRGHLHLCGVHHILDKAWMAWRSPNLVSNLTFQPVQSLTAAAASIAPGLIAFLRVVGC